MRNLKADLIGSAPNWAADAVLLGWRIVVGIFLIWGVSDNIRSADHMATFVTFLGAHGFLYPEVLGPVSVWSQFLCGIAFILGLGTRWAGLVCAFNFAVALVMVDSKLGVRAAMPAVMLLMFGLYLAARGAGSLGLDARLARTSATERDLPEPGHSGDGRSGPA